MIIEPLVRDEDGYGVHTLIPDTEEEYIDLSKISAFRGRNISRIAFEDDAPEMLVTRFFENDDADISEWTPTPPEPNAILIAVSDTDDGPYAWFVSNEETCAIDPDTRSRPSTREVVNVSGSIELDPFKVPYINDSIGYLAMKYGGLNLPIQVCESGAGFYIGTKNDSRPVSRESIEYFGSEEEAVKAIKCGSWTQRQEP